MPGTLKRFLDRDPWKTIILVLVFALIVGLCAYALQKNPQLNPRPVGPVVERTE